MPAKLLVTGASGQLGRGVIEHLIADRNIAPKDIIAVTRDPAKLGELAARGVSVRQGDLGDAASLEKAFAGADRVLIISTDTAPGSGERVRQQHNVQPEDLLAFEQSPAGGADQRLAQLGGGQSPIQGLGA